MKNEELEQMIEKSLSMNPEFCLPSDFAKKVTVLVSRREEWKTNVQEYFHLIAVFILLLITVTIIYYFIDKNILIHSLNFIAENKYAVIFAAVILNFVFFADRVLLRFLFSRWSRT